MVNREELRLQLAKEAYRVLGMDLDDPWDRVLARRQAIGMSAEWSSNQLRAFAVADAALAVIVPACQEVARRTKTMERQIGGIYSYDGPYWVKEQEPVYRDGQAIAKDLSRFLPRDKTDAR